MRKILMLMAVALVALTAVTAAPAASTSSSSCSDIGYLNSAIKSAKKDVAALKLAGKSRWAAALVPANAGLWIAKHAAQPCDEGTESYWLHRQYSIHYNVALVRYLEESKRGNWDSADSYWGSVEFWSDEIRDLQLAW